MKANEDIHRDTLRNSNSFPSREGKLFPLFEVMTVPTKLLEDGQTKRILLILMIVGETEAMSGGAPEWQLPCYH